MKLNEEFIIFTITPSYLFCNLFLCRTHKPVSNESTNKKDRINFFCDRLDKIKFYELYFIFFLTCPHFLPFVLLLLLGLYLEQSSVFTVDVNIYVYRRERHISNLKSRCQSVQEKNANVYEVPVNQQYIMRMYVHRKYLE